MATQPFIANTTSPSNAQASLTFVTGAHALKVGFNDTWGGRHATYDSPAEVGLTYRFNTVNGVTTPNLITEYATPYSNSENLTANLGIYAQDKWTLKRLTLNRRRALRLLQHLLSRVVARTGPARAEPQPDVSRVRRS